MPRVTVESFVERAAAGTPHGFLGGEQPLLLVPIEEDVYFRHVFTAAPAGMEDGLAVVETISNTYITTIEVITPGFENANTSLVSISANGATQAVANGYFTGVFDRYFWRYHYAHDISANTAFYSDIVGYPEANTAKFPELPSASDKPIVYWGKPDPRRQCTVAITVRVEYTGGYPSVTTGETYADFVFQEDILNNWDVFRRRIIDLRTDGRLGPYNNGDTWNKAEYPGLVEELDSVDNVIEFGYTQLNLYINTTSISNNIQIGTIEVV